jgi:FMN-binding domain
MRRAILALGGTIAGIAVLLSFKTHSTGLTGASAAAPSMPGGTGSSASAGGAADAAGAAATPGTSGKARAGKRRTVAGKVAETLRGPMQVELTLAGQRITKVTMLQRTNSGAESDAIDATAIPKLISETLAAQSAHIDAVSGATYTSEGYLQSLQSALDKARG